MPINDLPSRLFAALLASTIAGTATAQTVAELQLNGTEVEILRAGKFGLNQIPDQTPSYLRLPGGVARWWIAANNGTHALDTTDFRSFRAVTTAGVAGESKAGLSPASPHGSAFDADYAGPGTVLPAADGRDLLMLYHAENHYGRRQTATGVTPFYASVGLARSSDQGASWRRIGQVVTGRERPGEIERPVVNAGASVPVALASGGYLYLFFKDSVSPGNPIADKSLLCLARAALDSDGLPGTWKKYFRGAFSEPGLGGNCDGLFPTPISPTGRNYILDPNPSFNAHLGAFVLTFMTDDGFSWTRSNDLLRWSPPRQFMRFDTPRVAALGKPGATYYYYQALMTPSEPSSRVTGRAGLLFYAKGIQTGEQKQNLHGLFAQGFSFAE